MSRPGQRFVPVRSIDNQAELIRDRARELLAGQRTAALNALRAIWPRSALSRRRARTMPMA
jgi:transposase